MYFAQIACSCHVGRVRRENEDNLYFFGAVLSEGNLGLPEVTRRRAPLVLPVTLAVFDGMGGEAYGEVAARIAAEILKDALDDDPRADLTQVCQKANSEIYQESTRRRVSAMGSTAVILRLSGSGAEVVNVGDSRAFLLRDGTLRQVSVDHTDAEFFSELGVTNRKPQLTQNLGLDPEETVIEPAISLLEVHAGDWFLLCSDGLTDMVSDKEIQSCLLSAADAETAVHDLLYAALDHGGKDNTTLICCRISA